MTLGMTRRLADAAQPLMEGGIVVLPTDTLYGIVARAEDPAAVERLYAVRQRTRTKPFIILLADISDAAKVGAHLSAKMRQIAAQEWPGPTSIIVPCPGVRWQYLHRGQKSLALRVPADNDLQNLLRQTGPLAAPSANLEGEPPATTILEARSYFGSQVDLYVEGSTHSGKPSRLIILSANGELAVLRP